MAKPLVIQTETLDSEARAWLEAQGAEVIVQSLADLDDALAQRASALVVRTYTRINPGVLAKLPNVKVIGRAGVALDNIDVGACRARGVEVVHTPGANSDAVAEYVFAMLFDATRPRLFLEKPIELPRWETLRKDLQADRELNEMTLGIYGMGRIGTRVARIARAFGMRVLYHDIRQIDPALRSAAEPVSREALLDGSDIVTVHVDDRGVNRGLLDADAFGRMKSDVLFISAARGLIVDPVAAAEFFIAHPAAQGLFDVHEPEPFGDTYPLLDIANVHLAPHIAAATAKARRNMSWVVRDVWRVLLGEEAEHAAPPQEELHT
ncbi:MAG: NAD(P)-dependent oxidoreductase [Planctomycetota bacterium]